MTNFPRMLHKAGEFRCIVQNDAERDAKLAEGWTLHYGEKCGPPPAPEPDPEPVPAPEPPVIDVDPLPDVVDDVPGDGFDPHAENAAAVKAHLETVTDLAEVQALRESEVAHPEYEGGRVGVLKAIDARIEVLQADPQTHTK